MATKQHHALLDSLITGGDIRNDADLARALKVAAPVISKLRNGRMPLGDTMRVNIMRRFRVSIERMDELDPPQ